MNTPSQISSCLAAVTYAPASATLTVRFHDGRTYQYCPVPASVYAQLLTADSLGQSFNRDVRGGGYAYRRLT